MKKNQNFSQERFNFELVVEFMEFLQNHQCLGCYSLNVLSVHLCTVGRFLYRTPPEIWIAGAFRYEYTPEGERFWNEIANEWNIVLRKFTL